MVTYRPTRDQLNIVTADNISSYSSNIFTIYCIVSINVCCPFIYRLVIAANDMTSYKRYVLAVYNAVFVDISGQVINNRYGAVNKLEIDCLHIFIIKVSCVARKLDVEIRIFRR